MALDNFPLSTRDIHWMEREQLFGNKVAGNRAFFGNAVAREKEKSIMYEQG